MDITIEHAKHILPDPVIRPYLVASLLYLAQLRNGRPMSDGMVFRRWSSIRSGKRVESGNSHELSISTIFVGRVYDQYKL